MMYKKRLIFLILVLLFAFTVIAMECVASGDNQMPLQLRMVTLKMGSSWYIYGATMAELIRGILPSGSRVDVMPYSGGIGNPIVIAKNDAEFGLGFGMSNKWAYEGIVAYEKKLNNLRGLVGGLDQYYLGIASKKGSGINNLSDLAKGKLAINLMTLTKGSMGEFATQQILEAYGITYDNIKAWGGRVEHTDFNAIVSSFKDGKADMFIQVLTKGHPAWTELAVTTDINFISLDSKAIDYLKKYGYSKAVLPANSFKGQNYNVTTVGFKTALITNTEMDDLLAYKITKTLVENKEKLVMGHKALDAFNPEKAGDVDIIGLPLHPGAEKYYKEKGLL